jgi:DUF1009 family protein
MSHATSMQKAAPSLRDASAHEAHGPRSTRVGLIAGWGRYPLLVAQQLVTQGAEVCCVGIRDHADPQLKAICHHYQWVGLAQVGHVLRCFRRHTVTEATMAGKIHKVRLFERGAWLHHLPDWQGLRTFWPHLVTRRKTWQDDSLLGSIVETFAAWGITLRPATDYVPELLVKLACLTQRRPSAAERQDIEFGWHLAKEMGRLDVGQSVAVKDRAPLAVEAVEGTDQCIRRAGTLCASGGFTVVKVAKPRQDMRFDVPTIGIGTLQAMAESGGRVLAVEAGRTIIIDQSEFVEFADRHRLSVVALDENGHTGSP